MLILFFVLPIQRFVLGYPEINDQFGHKFQYTIQQELNFASQNKDRYKQHILAKDPVVSLYRQRTLGSKSF